jgi:hypothetical protein
MIGTALTPYEVLGNDTEVYVLNEAGNLIFNHDGANLAQVNAGQLAGMPAGVHLIAYNLFSSTPISSQLNPIIGWNVNPYKSQTGTVFLNLTGAEFVPEASSVLLLGLGLIGIARRFRKANSYRFSPTPLTPLVPARGSGRLWRSAANL